MSYEISISESGKYIRVRVMGDMTIPLAKRIAADSVTASDKHEVRCFLYDVRESVNVESPTANYFFANEDMVRAHFDRTARSAILTREGDRSHDFVETVFRNAGYNVRLFTDEKEAIRWLEG